MTFNIQHGLVWTKNEIKLGKFARYIKNQDPDFCGLNEVRGKGVSDPEYTNQAAKIGAAADYNNYFGQSVKIGGTEPYGNALLSKTPLKSAETVKIPDPDTGTAAPYRQPGFRAREHRCPLPGSPVCAGPVRRYPDTRLPCHLKW